MLCISIQGTTKLCTGQLLSLAFLLSVVYHLFHFCLVGLPPFPFCVSGFLFPSWFHRSTILSTSITLAHAQGVLLSFFIFSFPYWYQLLFWIFFHFLVLNLAISFFNIFPRIHDVCLNISHYSFSSFSSKWENFS